MSLALVLSLILAVPLWLAYHAYDHYRRPRAPQEGGAPVYYADGKPVATGTGGAREGGRWAGLKAAAYTLLICGVLLWGLLRGLAILTFSH